MNYVYILRSKKDNRLYVGRTDNLKRRFQEHITGKAWTTKRMLPVTLIFYEAFINKNDAIKREKYFKTSKGRSTIKMMLTETLRYAGMAELVDARDLKSRR